ncbi:Mitochondrial distribution and morphology protein 12 [Mortierella claussenii]|nr:Mitochondrial distribution and morphology protein 12 [Mortierella claussenii]
MSFVFSWDKLDDEVALQIEGMIHAHFQRIPKPAFMGNIAVSKFRFGSTPPNITVLDVTDPLEEWYVHMDQEDARVAREAAEAGGGESMDEDELESDDDNDMEDGYDNNHSYSADGSIVMVGEGDDMEYLDSGPFDEGERLEAEDWLLRQQYAQRQASRNGSNSGDSLRGEREGNNQRWRKAHGRSGGSASEQEASTTAEDTGQYQYQPATASPTKRSPSIPSSPVSSASSTQSAPYGYSARPSIHRHRHQDNGHETVSYAQTSKRNNRNLKLDIGTGLSSSTPYNMINALSTRKSGTTHSLSSHASDDDIESEAFYTQGESTIYQRLKNLNLDATEGREVPETYQQHLSNHPQHPQPGASLFPSTPVGTSGNMNSGPGFGFGLGIGSGPGGVLSSVMQSRSGTRPLSAASFYSTPTTAATAANGGLTSVNTTSTLTAATAAAVGGGAGGQQGPQHYFPDLAGMVVSGNSLLGLRAGTPSRTLPGTPRGFESPTLAFSRRQSFSDTLGDEAYRTMVTSSSSAMSALEISTVESKSVTGAETLMSELQNGNKGHHHRNSSVFLSPVEALSFEAFSQQPKVVERLKDEEKAPVGTGSHSRPGSQSYQGDRRNRSSSMRLQNPDNRHLDQRTTRSVGGNRSAKSTSDKRRQKKQAGTGRSGSGGYIRGEEPRTPASSSPSMPAKPSKRNENDIQLLMSVQYQGQMGFTVETELLLNYPTFAFLALPVKLVITGFSFNAKVLMGYLCNHVNVCFLEPEDPNESILTNVRVESQVGDEQKQAALKNVGKIERFVVEQLRKFITEDFVYPSYHSIELLRAPSTSTPETTPNSPSVSTTATSSRSGQQFSTAASVAAHHTAFMHSGTTPGSGHTRQGQATGSRGGESHGSAGSVTTSASRAGDASSMRARSTSTATSNTSHYRRH